MGPARKSIGFLTNSPCIAKRMSFRCPNKGSNNKHDHVILINGRAKAAEIYPPGLCKAVCEGFIEQIQVDQMGQFLIAEVNDDGKGSGQQMNQEAKQFKERYRTVEEDTSEELERAWDDVSGAELDASAVRKARAEEVEYVRKLELYTKVPLEECYAKSGRGPIIVRWIDINKGDHSNPNCRSRLVAREIDASKRDDLFAGTPPLASPHTSPFKMYPRSLINATSPKASADAFNAT